MEQVVQAGHLRKQYGSAVVVEDFSLTMEKGHIYGLIGPNGAGKTTIMKMLAGLVMPDGGEMRFFGDAHHLDGQRSRMSFMIETPYLDNAMSAWENVNYIRLIRGGKKISKVDEVLEFAGLAHTGNKKAGHFSLGMKQRLGIAMALVSDPEVMVLDEPVNGLDPEGIVEVRNMLRTLSRQGKAILISSHLLSELSEICSDFIILCQGRIVEECPAGELAEKCRNYLSVRTNDQTGTLRLLEKLNICDYLLTEDGEFRLFEKFDALEELSRAITDSGLIITRFAVQEEKLENYYLSKVEKFHA